MSRYLIVAHQTASSPEIVARVREVLAEDAAAEFTILVPELPTEHVSWEGEDVDAAAHRAESAKAMLVETAGARVVRTAVGVSDPLEAIAQELSTHPDYDGLIVCTLPQGVSRWLQMDLLHRAERRFQLPVTHVVGQAVEPAHH
ncbi:MAG: hypothetical protein GEU80_13730 [Dehalococcoidia bacterium]|nr:hypothetical protein [Dehalococcoidia bacterium]